MAPVYISILNLQKKSIKCIVCIKDRRQNVMRGLYLKELKTIQELPVLLVISYVFKGGQHVSKYCLLKKFVAQFGPGNGKFSKNS